MSASDGPKASGLERRPASAGSRATREALQPSLWDRLINDLPGLSSEIDGLRAALREELGEERLDALTGTDARRIEADLDLTPDQKRRLGRLRFQELRRAELERRGVVVSADILREAVRRDIEMLFNTERFEVTPLVGDAERGSGDDGPLSLDDFLEVRRSVVNYGVPPFSGRSSRDFDRDVLEREIQSLLATFEPRLKSGATKVTVATGDKSLGLRIEIDSVLILTPVPERLRLRTTIDLDNGAARTELGEA